MDLYKERGEMVASWGQGVWSGGLRLADMSGTQLDWSTDSAKRHGGIGSGRLTTMLTKKVTVFNTEKLANNHRRHSSLWIYLMKSPKRHCRSRLDYGRMQVFQVSNQVSAFLLSTISLKHLIHVLNNV